MIDSDPTLAQARAVIEAEGFASFRPAERAYRYGVAGMSPTLFPQEQLQVLAIAEIEPPARDAGVALFPRAKQILEGVRRGDKLPPIRVEVLPEVRGQYRYKVADGFHRFHLSRALGYSEIAAIVLPCDDPGGQ